MTHEFKHPNYYKDLREKSKGLWHNIHKKRKEGRPMRKKGEKGAPTADDIKKAQGESYLVGTPEIVKAYKKATPGQNKEKTKKEHLTFKEFSLNENPPVTADAMKRYKAGKAGFTDIAHLKAKGLIPRSDGEKRKSDKYK